MERSQECESVIPPPLQLNEGFFVLTHTASFTPRSNQFSSLSKMVTSLWSTIINNRANLSCNQTCDLLHLYLDNTYFGYNGQPYQQCHGCPMGSPVSPIDSSLYMEQFEHLAICCCCCCCRPHSTNVLPAESSTRIMWQPTVSPPRWQGKAPLCRDSSRGPG